MSNHPPTADQEAILRTLAYYDVFDYPLTIDELWRWLFPRPGSRLMVKDQAQLETVVTEMATAHELEQLGGYITLPGRIEIIEIRTTRTLVGQKKWSRATTTAKFLEIVPFVKMVAVVNTLAIDNARPESDIDLLIVTAPQHIWLARMMVTGIVSMLGYRRSGGRAATKIANQICLSFYVTTDALDMEPLKRGPDDPHFAFWTAQAVPLLDDGTYLHYQAANGWITELLPHAWSWDWQQKVLVPSAGLRSIKQFYQIFLSTPIGLWIENWVRQRQRRRFERDTESRSRESDSDVVISEDVLKFHEHDRRLEYRQKFQVRLRTLGIDP